MKPAESYFIGGYIPVSNYYPAWWESTITVYNKYIDPITRAVSWYPTTLRNCFWAYASLVSASMYLKLSYLGIREATNTVICRVPKNEKFLEPGEWKESQNKGDFFTFSQGDIIVRGEVTETINEYVDGSRSTDFIKKHKDLGNCIQINQLQVNVGTGRCLEHYYITGE